MKSTIPYFLVKLSISAVLVYYALTKVDINAAIDEIVGISIYVMIVNTLVILGTHCLGAIRLSALLEALYRKVSLTNAIKVTMIGAFFSQTMVSVGGDAVRIWHLTRLDMPIKIASHGIILDRISGLTAMMSVIIICLPFILDTIPTSSIQEGLILSMVAGCVTIAGLFSIARLPQSMTDWKLLRWVLELSRSANSVLRNPKNFILTALCSVAIQLTNVLALFIITKSISLDISYFSLLALTVPVIFLSLLPISIAGCGVRETAMVMVLGLYGVPPHQSVALSICYGLLCFVASTSGAIFFLLNRK